MYINEYTNKTQFKRALHGQEFIGSLSKESYIFLNDQFKNFDLSFKNLSGFTEEEKNFLNIIKTKKSFPFPINPHEIYQLSKINPLLNKIKYLVHRFRIYRSTNLREIVEVPPHLLIEPVSSCNLRCPMCFQTDKTFTKKPYMGIMDFDLFTNIIDQADELGIGAVTLASRGEPLMHPKIIEMLNYVASKDNIFELKINTNGMFLNAKIADAILKAPVSIFVLSADHYQKEKYEKIRKNSDFETIITNLKRLYKKRSEIQGENHSTEIRVSGINYFKNLDKEKFSQFWKKYADNISVGDAIERWDTYFNIPHPELNTPCNTIWNKMYIWFDGLCNPCDADYKSYLSYGNVKTQTIKEIWFSKKLTNLRNDHLSGKRNCHIPCDRCSINYGK